MPRPLPLASAPGGAALLSLLLLAIAGCRGPRVCPTGTRAVTAGLRAVWCQRADGSRAAWVELYEDGKHRRQQCPFAGRALEGAYESWHPNDGLWITGRYLQARKQGTWVQHDPGGRRVAEGQYRDGRLVGGAPVAVAATCEKLAP